MDNVSRSILCMFDPLVERIFFLSIFLLSLRLFQLKEVLLEMKAMIIGKLKSLYQRPSLLYLLYLGVYLLTLFYTFQELFWNLF